MKNAQGLSLLEVLIAFAVVSITFLALAMSQLTGFRVTRDSAEAATARDLASRQIEIIRGYGYATYGKRTAVTATGTVTTPYEGCPTNPAGSSAELDSASPFPNCAGSDIAITNFPGYTVSWAVAPSADAAPTGGAPTDPPALYNVNVTVTRDDFTYVLASYLSCADAGETSNTGIVCPAGSLLP